MSFTEIAIRKRMAGWMDRYADKLQNQKDKFLNTRNNQLADRIINLIFSSTYEWKKNSE